MSNMFLLGEQHPNWKGSRVGYSALHEWVSKRLVKPKLCTSCKKLPPRDLANKGVYNRALKNWEWLCRSCHLRKDGRDHRGEKNGSAKLTKALVLKIRSEHDGSWGSFARLGRKYGVAGWTISQIIKQKHWV